jgi:hypothetical protein
LSYIIPLQILYLENSRKMDNQVLYAAILVVLILMFLGYREYNKDYSLQVMEAIAKTEKENLQFTEFKNILGAPGFNVLAFARLMAEYKAGTLTQEKTGRILGGQTETFVN